MGRRKNRQKTKNKMEPNKTDEDTFVHNEEIIYDNTNKILVQEIGELKPAESSLCGQSLKKTFDKTTGDEIMFEDYNLNTRRVRGRDYFIHSLCQVCKEELNDRVLCVKCQLVSYCSVDHQKQHWPLHKDLCAAIGKVCADRKTDHIMDGSVDCSANEFRIFRFQNMVESEAKVGRPLDSWEREIFLFPNVCGICHKYDSKDLVTCERCKHSGFCKNHGTNDHTKWCQLLSRHKNIIKDQSKFGIVCPTVPKTKLSQVLPNLEDMKQVFKGVLTSIDIFEYIELTEITTYPLTALLALLKIKSDQIPSKVTIHVIGAEADFEINQPKKWEYYILHLIPNLKSLEIEFIGPELRPTMEQKSVGVCSKCKQADKSMTLKFHRDFYHMITEKTNFSKPQLICVFNPGLYRTTGFCNEDSWMPTINTMFAQNCPVLTTAYTHKEVHMDVQRVKQTQNISLLSEPKLNPFTSLKPNLNLVSDEESPVIFKNQYYCIMYIN